MKDKLSTTNIREVLLEAYQQGFTAFSCHLPAAAIPELMIIQNVVPVGSGCQVNFKPKTKR